jgi:hypothetical protein
MREVGGGSVINLDSYHILFCCSKYANIRHTLLHNLSWLLNDCVLDLNHLTSDNHTLSNEHKEIMFEYVFEYIKRSERFLLV